MPGPVLLLGAVMDVTDATFEAEVLDRSEHTPVVVDLWADWCGPCKTLGPIIERVVDATGGRVVLAKVDVDANPDTSALFQVQGIPAVFALKDRKVVDTFTGAQPEPVVAEFVGRLVPSETDERVAELIEAGDEDSLRAALDLVADHGAATVALAELLVADGRTDDALALLDRIPETAETRRVAALARTGGAVADDPAARLDALIDQVKDDETARQEYLDLLEVMGADDSRTADYRKALTARLF
jgi:putative thioredoxin